MLTCSEILTILFIYLVISYTTVEFPISHDAISNQTVPHAASLSDGGFVVVYACVECGYPTQEIYLQRFDSAGTKIYETELLVSNQDEYFSNNPSVAGLGQTGRYVVTYQREGASEDESGILLCFL